jgi:hypothetical protein
LKVQIVGERGRGAKENGRCPKPDTCMTGPPGRVVFGVIKREEDMTEHARVRFVVKESANGAPRIVCEPMGISLSILKTGLLGFDLPNGCTYERAHAIARHLEDTVIAVTYSPFQGR